jgi:predicted carbohydrate-binding protein with CBM48
VSELDDLMIARVARELRKPERIDPAFDQRVMAEIHAGRSASAGRSAWRWLVRPRSFQLSPLGGFALAGTMAAVMMLAVARGNGPRADRTTPTDATTESRPRPVSPIQTVQFVFRAPSAHRVALVGDFNDWDSDATPLRPAAGGLWTVTVPLSAGRYTYTFVVDGERWMADPAAPPAPPDDFGRPGSVLTIGESAS